MVINLLLRPPVWSRVPGSEIVFPRNLPVHSLCMAYRPRRVPLTMTFALSLAASQTTVTELNDAAVTFMALQEVRT